KDTKGLNPTFNQTFCFYVLPGQDKLYIKAVDKDPLVNDKTEDEIKHFLADNLSATRKYGAVRPGIKQIIKSIVNRILRPFGFEMRHL
ncbi:MAG: hypothetical protein ABJA71_16390, partial [Ginsengibacter sp.]